MKNPTEYCCMLEHQHQQFEHLIPNYVKRNIIPKQIALMVTTY